MTEFPDRPGYSFNPGPPPEASRYLRNKGMRPAFSWADVEPEEHAVAFTVAKAMELDVLAAIRGEVQKALDEGLPFATFKKNFRANPALAEWWGQREMVDPLTGERQLVQLGSARRLRTIYRANLRSARAAGQWERIERTKEAFPFIEYRLGPSEHHRPHHEAKAGMILPVESPFWDEWMPPNGWGCKCWVRQVTKAEAKRRGVSTTPDVPDVIVENQRTGERQLVPQGIDPGWQRNPGKLRRQTMEALLNGKLEAVPVEVAQAAARDIATSWRVQRIMAGGVGVAPVAVLPDALHAELGRMLHVSEVTRTHLVDEKVAAGQASRAAFVDDLAMLSSAQFGFVDATKFGPAWHLFAEGAYPKTGKGLYAVIWRVNGQAVLRTLFPTPRSYVERQAARASTVRIDFGE